MTKSTAMSRRTFIKTFSSGVAVGLTVSAIPSIAYAKINELDDSKIQSLKWAPNPGIADYRIDGLVKVLGQKIYARDFHAQDMPNWPNNENFLYALRCNKINQIVNGYDLSMLPPNLMPIKVIDGKLLLKDNMSMAGNMLKPFFAKPGESPLYYGQPIAMLIFENFETYRHAEKLLQFNPKTISYGNPILPEQPIAYDPIFEYVRDDTQNFNYVNSEENYEVKSKVIAAEISAEINSGKWQTISRKFKTQTMDPMFMEPESGLTWYDIKNKKLHLVIGTQSPTGDISAVADIFHAPNCRFKLDSQDGVELVSCYPGGGFGGRDDSYFTMYLAMSAPYANAPLRWMNSRFEQFQVGLKRHFTAFSESLAFDSQGKIKALDCDFVLNGGGRKNLSPYVAELATLSSFNAYEIPKAVARGKALNTPDLLGGSQRGFGGPQAFLAIETLLDEVAQQLKLNPFTLRRINFINQDSKTITGAPIEKNLRLDEIITSLEKNPLWINRVNEQQKYADKNLKYGVGFAMSNQAYGTSGDGMYGGIQINEDGSLTVRTPYVDMGNGAATTLGLGPSTYLGRNATDIKMGDAGFFDALGLTTSGSTDNPKYVLKGSGSSSACLGAFYQYHAIEQAGLTLLLESVLPAAMTMWNINNDSSSQSKIDYQKISWINNKLQYDGLADLLWNDIVRTIYKLKYANTTAVHATYIGEFAKAEFTFSAVKMILPLDYIAMGSFSKPLNTVKRSSKVKNPPAINQRFGRTTYAPCAALMAVSIEPSSGKVTVEDCVTVLNAGVQLSPQIVSGQSQGGVAMAMGYVLYEDCPNTDEGPGNGTWNLNKYTVARMTDVPLKQQLTVLAPLVNDKTAKGVAEAVLCPLAPALLNAIAMAVNHRFSSLPVTASAIKEVLL